MEESVGKDSGVTIVAKRDGKVDSVDSGRIVVSATNPSCLCWQCFNDWLTHTSFLQFKASKKYIGLRRERDFGHSL